MAKSVYSVHQFDVWFQNEYASFGIFESKELAVEEMKKGFEKLYPGFNESLTKQSEIHWMCNKHEFGVLIQEVELNLFEEI